MGGRRKEYPLDVYKLGLGAFIFLSPWLFALTYAPARVESMISGATVMLLSLAALIAFGDGSLRRTLPGISSAHRHATTLRVNAITTSL